MLLGELLRQSLLLLLLSLSVLLRGRRKGTGDGQRTEERRLDTSERRRMAQHCRGDWLGTLRRGMCRHGAHVCPRWTWRHRCPLRVRGQLPLLWLGKGVAIVVPSDVLGRDRATRARYGGPRDLGSASVGGELRGPTSSDRSCCRCWWGLRRLARRRRACRDGSFWCAEPPSLGVGGKLCSLERLPGLLEPSDSREVHGVWCRCWRHHLEAAEGWMGWVVGWVGWEVRRRTLRKTAVVEEIAEIPVRR